jgi:hypothetical protein
MTKVAVAVMKPGKRSAGSGGVTTNRTNIAKLGPRTGAIDADDENRDAVAVVAALVVDATGHPTTGATETMLPPHGGGRRPISRGEMRRRHRIVTPIHAESCIQLANNSGGENGHERQRLFLMIVPWKIAV